MPGNLLMLNPYHYFGFALSLGVRLFCGTPGSDWLAIPDESIFGQNNDRAWEFDEGPLGPVQQPFTAQKVHVCAIGWR